MKKTDDLISRQGAIDALRKRIPKHPLESHYEEGIAVGLARAENTIEALKPAAVLPYSIEPDGTLTITVPKGTTVSRVLVEEDGTQWGGLFYAD